MTPLRLSYIWYRRMYIALFIAALTYGGLYIVSHFTSYKLPSSAQVDTAGAIGAALVLIGSGVAFAMAKRTASFLPAFAVFALTTLLTAYLVQSSGGVSSAFLLIWSFLVCLAPLFGAYGWLPTLVITSSYFASEYLVEGISTQTFILVLLSSVVPLIVGLIAWRNTPDSDTQSRSHVKHLANQLSEVAAKSEIVINAIGDGVLAVDGKGIVQLINPAAQEILGWGKQDALMLSYKSILKLADLNGNDLDPSQDPIQQVLNTNQQSRGNKLTSITSSGKKLSISLVASPIGDPGSGVIAVFRDTTNERAEEREQAEFISTASHEMRTPVASIEGYLGLALNPNTATIDQKARDFILKAHEAAQHLGRLFQDLLDVSKSEDGRLTNTPRVIDVVPFTQTIIEGLRQKAAEKNLRLVFTPEEGSGGGQGIKKLMPVYYVNLDNDHLREVLDNLIENGIKYTPEGEVRLDISGTEERVVISIKDTGLGIPTEDIPHLFQKFYRVENMDRQSIGGTGLGLYLCRRLVEAMQGRVWVESTYGSGSTFFVELPRIDTQEATRLKEEQARAAEAQSLRTDGPAAFAPEATVPPAPAGKSIPVSFADDLPAASAPAPAAPAAPAPAPLTPAAAPAQPAAPAPVTPTPEAPTPAAAAIPVPTPVSAPVPTPTPTPTPAPESVATGVKPATTVPRGESLTRDQINQRVRQLEALAQQQRGSVTPPERQ